MPQKNDEELILTVARILQFKGQMREKLQANERDRLYLQRQRDRIVRTLRIMNDLEAIRPQTPDWQAECQRLLEEINEPLIELIEELFRRNMKNDQQAMPARG